ncbi:MAG: ribosomal protein L13e [Candidatus Bathyarchaeia archaeon]
MRNRIRVFKNRGEKRAARGFSKGELKKAGMSSKQALHLGLPTDVRRRTIHEENVELATQQLQNLKTATKTSKAEKAS